METKEETLEEEKVNFTSDSTDIEKLIRPSSPLYTLAFLLFGVTTLLSWNAILNNILFLESKFTKGSFIHGYFNKLITISSMLPVVVGNLLNLMFLCRLKPLIRVLIFKVTALCGFIVFIFVVNFEMSEIALIIIMLMLAFVMNLSSPILISALFDDVGLFEFSCFTSFNAGQALSGFLMSLLKLILIPTKLSDKRQALLFFVLTAAIVLISIICYTVLVHTQYYKRKRQAQQRLVEATHKSFIRQFKEFYFMLIRTWVDSLALYLTLTVTLFILPNLLLSIKSIYEDTVWSKSYFTTVTIFLSFTGADFVGRYLNLVLKWPKPSTVWILILPLVRIVFILLFFMCENSKSPASMRGYLGHDAVFTILVFLFGLTNSHLITIIFGRAYMFETQEDKATCSTLFVLLLGLGLATGSFLSFIL